MYKSAFFLKVFLIWMSAFGSILIYEGCCGRPDFPYQEITSIELFLAKNQLDNSDSLKIQIIPTQFKYHAMAAGTISSAFAWQCESDGYLGVKHKFTEIEITSNQDFDGTHSAGVALNDLFFVKSSFGNNIISLTGSTPVDSLVRLLTNGEFLITDKRPSINLTHQLTIRIQNENNTHVSSTVNVSWK
ncbi:MAG: hypothetical protein JNM78_03355 [Cyclobacteriaceae bacterium]|nr:hypothetical protein [Cyclobacteriaceae bacterium]